MATKNSPVNPSPFDGFDVLEGFDPIDKAELVGQAFGITAVRFRTNERHVEFAEIELVTVDGEEKQMSDSSSGVRDQIKAYLASKGMEPGSDAWEDVKLFVPRGLRVSEYEVTDERGKSKHAKTYYLTAASRKR